MFVYSLLVRQSPVWGTIVASTLFPIFKACGIYIVRYTLSRVSTSGETGLSLGQMMININHTSFLVVALGESPLEVCHGIDTCWPLLPLGDPCWYPPPPCPAHPPCPLGVTWPVNNKKSIGNHRRRPKILVGYARIPVSVVWCPSPLGGGGNRHLVTPPPPGGGNRRPWEGGGGLGRDGYNSDMFLLVVRGGGGGSQGPEMTKWRLRNSSFLLMVKGIFRRRSRLNFSGSRKSQQFVLSKKKS